MPAARVNGVELFYQTQGSGDPLLLIAGFACDHTTLSLVLPALAARHRVIAFDNRGVGHSPPPAAPTVSPRWPTTRTGSRPRPGRLAAGSV
jgi:pimeloyl-ACP methyl ester carboxylesterase